MIVSGGTDGSSWRRGSQSSSMGRATGSAEETSGSAEETSGAAEVGLGSSPWSQRFSHGGIDSIPGCNHVGTQYTHNIHVRARLCERTMCASMCAPSPCGRLCGLLHDLGTGSVASLGVVRSDETASTADAVAGVPSEPSLRRTARSTFLRSTSSSCGE